MAPFGIRCFTPPPDMDDGQPPAPDGVEACQCDYAETCEHDGHERNAVTVVAPDPKHDEPLDEPRKGMIDLDVAGLRITDGDDSDDGDDASTAALSFTPASASVIAGRTIVKGRRPKPKEATPPPPPQVRAPGSKQPQEAPTNIGPASEFATMVTPRLGSDAGHEVDEFSPDEACSVSTSGLSLGESATAVYRISQEQPRPPPDADAEGITLPGSQEFATDGDGDGDGGCGGNGGVGGDVPASVPDFLGSLPSLMLDQVIQQLGLRELVRLGSSSSWLARAVFEREELWTTLRFDQVDPDVAASLTDEALDRLLRRINAGEPS